MIGCPWPHLSALTGQDQRAQSEQRGGSVLHPDRWAGVSHARGSGGVLLQVPNWVEKNEGEKFNQRFTQSLWLNHRVIINT